MVTIPRTRAPSLRGAGGWIGVDAPLSLRDLRGKVVLLDFWTSCCINCVRVIEELRPLEQRFGEALVVIGVHSPKFPHEHRHATVEQAVRRYGITHPVLDDPTHDTWDQYGVKAWPTLVVIDPEGYVVGMTSGEGHADELAALIEQLIAEHDIDRSPVVGTAPRPPAGPLAFPGKVATDGLDRLAIADTGHHRVLVTDAEGRVERVVDGLRAPQGVRFDGDRLLVCDTGADRVVAVDLADGQRRVLFDGIASPWDVIVEPDGSVLVAEAGRHRLWRDGRIAAGTGAEALFDAPVGRAAFAQPSGLTRVEDGVIVADAEGSALRLVGDDGEVRTLIGRGLFSWGRVDGTPDQARLQHPLGVAARWIGDRVDAVYVADTFNSLLRVWRDGLLQTLAIGGLAEPGGLDVLPDGRLVVADTNAHRILLVDPGTGRLEVLPIRGAEPAATGGTAPADAGEPLATRAGDEISLPFAVDTGGGTLDPSGGAPVRVTVDSEPAGLVVARTWGLHAPSGHIAVTAGAPGEGHVIVDITAATCDDRVCRVHRRTVRHPLRVTA